MVLHYVKNISYATGLHSKAISVAAGELKCMPLEW